MGLITTRAALALGAAALFSATPAHAELINASNPATIKAILESQGWPATLVSKPGDDPYLESNRGGLKFLVLFMNCEEGKKCKTLQYYMGFSDAQVLNVSPTFSRGMPPKSRSTSISSTGSPSSSL